MNYAANDNAPIRYATICSGIEGVSVAWEPLGNFKPVFFSEVKPFPKAVLAHHWPEVPDLGDMTKIDGARWQGKVDVLWGSTPCQSFSKAGKQAALKDERGQLTPKFVELANTINPKIIAWENVKNVLAANDNAFGQFLGALAGEDHSLQPAGSRWTNAGYVRGPHRQIAWRVFDAQYASLAARRERVFLVATPLGGADPRDILWERDFRGDGCGHPEAGRGTWKRLQSAAVWPNPFTGRPTGVDGPVAFNADTSPKCSENLALTLRSDTASGGFLGIAVRDQRGLHAFRATPEMWEAMLGFPRGWTNVEWAGRGRLERHRRAALGNSLAVPDVRWIMARVKSALTGELTLHHWPDPANDNEPLLPG